MSGFLLDTNVPSELLRTQPDPKVTAWIAAQDLDSLFLSVVSFGELCKRITIMSAGKRKPDAQIAATALEHALTVVTRNVKDFENLGFTALNPWDGA